MRRLSSFVAGLLLVSPLFAFAALAALAALAAACGSDPSTTDDPTPDSGAPGASSDATGDAKGDEKSNEKSDASIDAAHDAPVDTSVTTDTGSDAPADASTDGGAQDADAGSPVDASPDASVDATPDATGAHDAASDAAPDATPPDAGPLACNGAPALCARRFDQVSYPTTHNAMSNSDDGFIGPNQHHTITRQLQDGIRALMLDTHYDGTVPSLCHQYCQLGKTTLVAGLSEIKAFLDANPHEVVTIIFESYISAADTKASFESAGLLARTHAHDVAQPWPTLQTLIQADQRVVVFTDNGGGTYPWYMDMWVHEFETDYSNKTKADLDCRPNRGVSTNALFILNHFLTNPIASELLAAQVNYDPFFLDKANECAARYHHIPNFVTVDFYDLGDVLTVSRTLNGL